MQKNWYIIYTKQKTEKKVSTALSKRKIENFVPLNSKTVVVFRKKKIQQEPLFKCYLFAYTNETEISKIKSIDGVINLVYWKDQPAMVGQDEIDLIKEFTSDYTDIKVERINVTENGVAKTIDNLRYSMSGNVLWVKNTVAKVKLPSIGFSMLAQIADENSLQTCITFGENKLVLQ
ncbi:MAG: UpxY family transcription antiterminator [Ginsengibacter sp.]